MEIGGFYRDVIKRLNENDVSFLLVGGLAVGFHGYARFTGDMDLWINPSSENLYKLGKALVDLNYSQEVVKEILDARPIDHPTPIRIFSEDNQLKVDLMTSIFYEPLTFASCYQRAVNNEISGYSFPVISIKDLIEIKSNVRRYDGNLKDLVDAQELRKILERGKSLEIKKRPNFIQRLFGKK